MRLYIGIALALFFSLAVWAGYKYYTDTQEALQTLAANNARLEIALEQEQENARRLQEYQRSQVAFMNELNEALADSEKPLQELNELLSKHNLTVLSIEKPGLIERRINDATDRVFKSIECETGNC